MPSIAGDRPEPATAGCPDANRLAAFAAGAPEPAEADAIEEHLAGCSSCRVLAAAVLRETSDDVGPPEWDGPPAPGAPAPAASPARSPRGTLGAAALLFAALIAATPFLFRTGDRGEPASPSAAADPVDTDSVHRALAAAGLVPAQPDDSSPPAESAARPCVVLAPRGPLEAAPAEVRIFAARVLEGLEVLLEPDDKSGLIARWPVPVAYRVVGLPLSAEQRAKIRPGRGYRVRVRPLGYGSDRASAAFRILSDAERAAEEGDWTALSRRTGGDADGDGDGARLLRAEWLLARGRADEALELARDVAVRHPGRREPSRIALVALERLGLRGEAPWREESQRLETAR